MPDRIIHLASSLDLLVTDAPTPGLGPELWQFMDGRCRNWLLCDCAPAERKAVFGQSLARARLCGIGLHRGRPFGVAWFVPFGPGAETWACHIAALGRVDAGLWLACGTALLEHVEASLVCLIPAPLYGAARLARRLGFMEVARLPRACWLASRGRCAGGRLMLKPERKQ